MARLLVEGRLTMDGPGGTSIVEAEGDTIRVEFPSVRSALAAWRKLRALPLGNMVGRAGLAVEVYVRGVRIRRFGD